MTDLRKPTKSRPSEPPKRPILRFNVVRFIRAAADFGIASGHPPSMQRAREALGELEQIPPEERTRDDQRLIAWKRALLEEGNKNSLRSHLGRLHQASVINGVVEGHPYYTAYALEDLQRLEAVPHDHRTHQQRQQIEWLKALLTSHFDGPPQG